MERYKLVYRPLPDSVKGTVCGMTYRCSGKYLVLIDSDLEAVEREKTLKHELSHILLGHFIDNEKNQAEKEREAEEHAEAMTNEEFSFLLDFAV